MSQDNQVLTFTAGIVNTPLTKPAKLFFTIRDLSLIRDVKTVYESNNIAYEMISRKHGTVYHFCSLHELPSSILKLVWRNYKTLRPKFQSDYRYFFFEYDSKDWNTVEKILDVYCINDLPVYCHETLHGYHFLCVKPIHKEQFRLLVTKVEDYNPKYPPLTLRIKANKYPNEIDLYRNGFIISRTLHSDTEELKRYIEKQEIDKLAQKYVVVKYPLKEGALGDSVI